MTLGEFLDRVNEGYFFVDPQGLQYVVENGRVVGDVTAEPTAEITLLDGGGYEKGWVRAYPHTTNRQIIWLALDDKNWGIACTVIGRQADKISIRLQ